MSDWRTALQALGQQRTAAVLVTVGAVQGSAPRAAGAKMVVSAHGQYDTIGGGHLEWRACEIAREMLAEDDARPRLLRFALGPSLGQCCGGAVQLVFERLAAPACSALARACDPTRVDARDLWRLVALDSGASTLVAEDAALPPQTPPFDCNGGTQLLLAPDGCGWLADPLRLTQRHLLLFGAGHVGAALVRALADLPCSVTWVDEREECFPPLRPANVQVECTDVPEAVVTDAAPGTTFLVMTHNHALDQRLAEAILRRGDALWFGLIGSQTKRVQFERRLRARGIEDLARMTCPIGLPGIAGKEPAVIAASVCAQLLQVWEMAERSAATAADTAARVFAR